MPTIEIIQDERDDEMKIYVASHDRWAAEYVATRLWQKDYRVVSTWHSHGFLRKEEMTDEQKQHDANRDVGEVMQCDALVLVSGPDRYPGGKFVEAGIAIGRGKHVFVLGPRENVLLWSDMVTQCASETELFDMLRGVWA